jgi:hypothetical protein
MNSSEFSGIESISMYVGDPEIGGAACSVVRIIYSVADWRLCKDVG